MTHGLEIELDVLLGLRDYLRASYWFLFKKLKLFFILIFVACVVYPILYLSGALVDRPRPETENVPWGLFVPVAILLLVLLTPYLSAKRNMASNKSIQERIRYSFSREGIRAIALSSSGYMAWDNIREAFETGQNFLLFISNNQMYTIPKRCFQDEEEMALFRHLLTEMLGSKAKLKRKKIPLTTCR